MPHILHLTLKKKWFDLIASGKKKFEYRESKPYWDVRLLNKFYDEIHFTNGYGKDKPFMRVKPHGIMRTHSSCITTQCGEVLDGVYYILAIGEILEIKNWKAS